jgi:hypothetical protein
MAEAAGRVLLRAARRLHDAVEADEGEAMILRMVGLL